MPKVLQKYGIFLLIPCIVLGFSILLKAAAGPYWLAPNSDPSYQYLINGLYLIKGIVPNHTDHPGTPLQMLFFIVYKFMNIGRSTEDIVSNVLMSPEFYLHIVFGVLTAAFFVTSAGLAVYIYRKTGDRIAAVLSQLPALTFLVLKSWDSFEPVFPVVVNVDPEPALMSVVNLFNLCLLVVYFSKASKDEFVPALFWGFVCGLGIAVKLTFLPLILVPLIVLAWKDKALFALAFMVSFVLWTLPIISRYHIIWGWFSGIALHVSVYVFLCALLFITVSVFVFQKWVGRNLGRDPLFLVATMAGIGLQFFAVTRRPGAHYLLPGLGLFSGLFVLFYLQNVTRHALVKRIAVVFILIGLFLGVWQANAYRIKLRSFTRGIVDFQNQILAQYPNCIFIDYYRSSSPESALFFGDGWNLSPKLGEELFRLYPNKYYFQIWGNRILNFKGRVWANDLLAQGSCVLFRGDGAFNFRDGPYDLRLLEKGRFESIHLLTGTTEKQAAVFLSGAMQYIQSGDYPKALACLLQARQFHYQPDSSIKSLIELLRQHFKN